MIVVSDTTPLRYLAEIGGLEWLPALWGEIVCPPEVLAECRHAHAPHALRAWASSPPPWLRVMAVPEESPALPGDDALDPGETAALRLALQIRADLVLLDERRGRLAASQLGLSVTGTLGILVEASLRGVAEFEPALRRLLDTNFRVDESVIAAARARLAATEDRSTEP